MNKTEIFIKIRNYHADNHNHVNNARYLEFFEESSWDYLEKNSHVEEMFASLMKKGIIHVVVNINCNFKSSAIVGDLLRIETKLMRSTNRSYTWSKEIFNNENNKLVIDAEITCVFINSTSGEVVPIDEQMKSKWHELAEKRIQPNQATN
jgi:thioesterase-3